jgi:hypothetical protein
LALYVLTAAVGTLKSIATSAFERPSKAFSSFFKTHHGLFQCFSNTWPFCIKAISFVYFLNFEYFNRPAANNANKTPAYSQEGIH